MKLQAPKGFKDYLPEEALKRKVVMDKIKDVFSKFGFDPLETPTLEYEETLTGKYGEDEKLIYKFETPGGDKVALKYDQTVPLARVVAQYGPRGAQTITMPFKRYQIQPAYRGENTQKGRYREFMQCDVDIIGVSSAQADAEILATADACFKALGLKNYKILVNSRKLLFNKISEAKIPDDMALSVIRIIDKVDKIGWDEMGKELIKMGLSNDQVSALDDSLSITQYIEQDTYLDQIIKIATALGVDSLKPTLYLARGLDYYTDLIFEVKLLDEYQNPKGSSLCGGGRWDEMIGKFTGTDMPAVGFAIGLDRTIEAMEEQGLVVSPKTLTKVLVTYIFGEQEYPLTIVKLLRSSGIKTEIWLDPESKLEKQLTYAQNKKIPFVILAGPDEKEKSIVLLKDLETGTQEKLTITELIGKLS